MINLVSVLALSAGLAVGVGELPPIPDALGTAHSDISPGPHQAASDAGADRPRFALSAQGSLFQPRARGSVFDAATSNLALGRSDFRMARVGGDAMVRVSARLHLFVGAETGDTDVSSRVRDTAGGTGAPAQNTYLEMNTAYVGGVAADLMRSPSGSTTLKGLVGVGRSGYRFEQAGSFPDGSAPGSTFDGSLETRGSGTISFAGLRVLRALRGPLALSADLRAQRGSADVGGDYLDFPPISLSGLSGSLGVTLQF